MELCSKKPAVVEPVVAPPELAVIDWNRVVTLDFETYYDQNYTLKKLSTSGTSAMSASNRRWSASRSAGKDPHCFWRSSYPARSGGDQLGDA